MSDARATPWQPDPLLARTPARSPSFVRMPWDEGHAQAFGPWRMQDKADPMAAQTEPAKNFSSTPAPDAAATGDGSPAMEGAADTASAAEPPAAAGSKPRPGAGPEGAHAAAAPGTGPVTVQAGGASEQELMVARQQGYVLGIKDGLSKALNDLEAERQKEREAIRSLMIELRALEQNPQRFFEPLRRLALHLAEQLVRGELSVSGQAIDRLVKSCLDDLGSHDKAVVVTLNPEDVQRFKALQIEAQSELRLDADPTLLPGSVRVRVHDAEIQDFIDTRLETLARRLLSDPEAWLQKSTLLHPHEVEPLPEDTPKRAWFSRPMEVQDTASKPVAEAEPLAEAESPTKAEVEPVSPTEPMAEAAPQTAAPADATALAIEATDPAPTPSDTPAASDAPESALAAEKTAPESAPAAKRKSRGQSDSPPDSEPSP